MKNKSFNPKQNKLLAAKYFSDQLIKQSSEDYIKAVVLFGSLAHGVPDKESDVDILIFSDYKSILNKNIWEAAVNTYKRYQESIEHLVYRTNKLANPDSYFLYQAIKKGRYLYPKSL